MIIIEKTLKILCFQKNAYICNTEKLCNACKTSGMQIEVVSITEIKGQQWKK